LPFWHTRTESDAIGRSRPCGLAPHFLEGDISADAQEKWCTGLSLVHGAMPLFLLALLLMLGIFIFNP
jgi:hypothetical protein